MCRVLGDRKRIYFQSLAGKILGENNKLTDVKLEQRESLLLLKTLIHFYLASLTFTRNWCHPRRRWRHCQMRTKTQHSTALKQLMF